MRAGRPRSFLRPGRPRWRATPCSRPNVSTPAPSKPSVDTGVPHFELFLTKDGPVFGELAGRPPGGYITDLITRAYNFDFWQAWLHLGLGEEIDSVPAPVRAAGAWLLHPGPGTLFEIAGVEEARAMAGVEKVIMRQQPGKVCGERLGSGQEAGHILVSGRDREQVARRLVDTHAKIRFVMGP